MKKLSNAVLFMLIYAQVSLAQKIEKPSWIKDIEKDQVSDAGGEIQAWIFIVMGVIIALFSIKPGYLFIMGKTEEAVDASKNILIGAVVAVVFGGVVFTVMNYLN